MARSLHFRRFSAVLPQEIRSLCTAQSAVIPQIFGTFSTPFAHVFHERFASNFLRVFPQPFRKKSEGISRLGRREKGEKEAEGGRMWKTVSGDASIVKNDHHRLGSRRECTQDVARGTVAGLRTQD